MPNEKTASTVTAATKQFKDQKDKFIANSNLLLLQIGEIKLLQLLLILPRRLVGLLLLDSYHDRRNI